MPKKQPKPKSLPKKTPRAPDPESVYLAPPRPAPPASPAPDAEAPPIEAFLEEAKKETKRKLISDHIDTIKLLRDEKRFTFRDIAEWLTARGIETDHSAVYRAYLSSIPAEHRDPREDWSDVDVPE
ncbi:MAG: hypothetical protein P4L99_06810 [Chthoniobacter sp.]|nr:hypothetical protein [Chthoniobacter sp.]